MESQAIHGTLEYLYQIGGSLRGRLLSHVVCNNWDCCVNGGTAGVVCQVQINFVCLTSGSGPTVLHGPVVRRRCAVEAHRSCAVEWSASLATDTCWCSTAPVSLRLLSVEKSTKATLLRGNDQRAARRAASVVSAYASLSADVALLGK